MGPLSTGVLVGYLAAITLLMITPGPDMMFVLANAARYGVRAGVVAAVGVAAGEAIHILAVVLGLATVITTSPMLFTAIKWGGAAYLVVLGLLALRQNPQSHTDLADRPNTGLGRAFTRGLLTNLLNPKMILFSVAFLPQFVDASAGNVTGQLITLGVLFVLVQLTLDIGLGMLAGRLAGRFTTDRWTRRIGQACAVTFIGLGLRLALG
ncbi:LysE family translocator [Micromonospora sp. NPDC003197]